MGEITLPQFDEQKWLARKRAPEIAAERVGAAIAKAMRKATRHGHLALVLQSIDEQRFEKTVADFLEPPKRSKAKPVKRKARRVSKVSRPKVRRRAGARAGEAQRVKRARKGPKATDGPKARQRPAQARQKPVKRKWAGGHRDSIGKIVPPLTQMILREMRPGEVYDFHDAVNWLPGEYVRAWGAPESERLQDRRHGEYYGRGKKPARLFWLVYDLWRCGIVGYRRDYCDDWTRRQFWLTADGVRYADVVRRNWNWRFVGAKSLWNYTAEGGPEFAFEQFVARARRVKPRGLHAGWIRRDGAELLEVDRCGW